MTGAEILCGDCLEILPQLELDPRQTVIVTDPPWPGCKVDLCRGGDPAAVFAGAAAHFARLARRAVVVLGCDTDPRLLAAMPGALPFVRVCWLRRTPPVYRGPMLYGADVAYVFGDSFLPGAGQRVLPGEGDHASAGRRDPDNPHPVARSLRHMRWLIANFTRPGMTVLDPFAGSGTTIVAAAGLGRRAIGIELEPEWCEVARRRLAAVDLPLLVV